MRSESARISSRSSEISSTAAPRSRWTTYVLGRTHVQPARGLSRNHDLRFTGEHAGEDDLLHVATGKGAGPIGGTGLDLKGLNEALGVFQHRFTVQQPLVRELVQVFQRQVFCYGEIAHHPRVAILRNTPHTGLGKGGRIGRSEILGSYSYSLLAVRST